MDPAKLVLPAPFGPTMAVTSPAGAARETSRTATADPYRTVTLSSSSMSGAFLVFGTEIDFSHRVAGQALLRWSVERH